jgi:Family of unknown function (DUF5372)
VRTAQVIHPVHAWCGREFVFVAVRDTWGEDRVFFFGDDGTQRSLPRGSAPPTSMCSWRWLPGGRRSASLTCWSWPKIFDGRGGGEDRVVVYQRRRGISSSLSERSGMLDPLSTTEGYVPARSGTLTPAVERGA